jgi:hypothetical protein
MRRSLTVGLLAVPALVACSSAPYREMPSRMVDGDPMYDVLPRDAIPSIDEPVFVSAEEAAAFMADDEPILGVVGANGEARAYSAWHLDAHEIVNDTLDGRPIMVTW